MWVTFSEPVRGGSISTCGWWGELEPEREPGLRAAVRPPGSAFSWGTSSIPPGTSSSPSDRDCGGSRPSGWSAC